MYDKLCFQKWHVLQVGFTEGVRVPAAFMGFCTYRSLPRLQCRNMPFRGTTRKLEAGCFFCACCWCSQLPQAFSIPSLWAQFLNWLLGVWNFRSGRGASLRPPERAKTPVATRTYFIYTPNSCCKNAGGSITRFSDARSSTRFSSTIRLLGGFERNAKSARAIRRNERDSSRRD